MREPLSNEFIVSFVETCMDMGLSKEATAELLQRRSAVHAAEQSPAFAEGYLQQRASMPARDAVRVRPGYVEKRAFGAALRTIGSGVGSLARGVGGLAGAAGKGLFRGAANNPRATKAIAGGLGAGGLGWGLSEMFGSGRYASPGAPYMPGSGYNPESEKQEMQAQLDRYSSGIADANKTISESAERRRVLQQAVDSNSPNSAQALAELNRLNAGVSQAEKIKAEHQSRLDSAGSTTASKLQAIQARQQQLRERQKSPFWRGLHWATFRNPDKSYQNALNELQGPAAQLSRDNQLIQGQVERMPYYKGIRYNQPSSTQMQREFFPTN